MCAVCVLPENKEDQYVGLDQKTDVQIITKKIKNKKKNPENLPLHFYARTILLVISIYL